MTSNDDSGRRGLLKAAAASAISLLVPPAPARERVPIRAVAFDGFAVFDPRPTAELAVRLYPGQGRSLMDVWRTRQFEYTWLRTLTDSYTDFWQVTADALTFAAKALKLEMKSADRDRLLQSVLDMKAWPDAAEALDRLKRSRLELVLLANPTASMLDGWIANSGLKGVFGPHLTTDRVRAFKPAPRAYSMGPGALGLPKEQIAFAAFGGWDAAGAKAFGYPTFWVNRLGMPAEELGNGADGAGASLLDLADFLAGLT